MTTTIWVCTACNYSFSYKEEDHFDYNAVPFCMKCSDRKEPGKLIPYIPASTHEDAVKLLEEAKDIFKHSVRTDYDFKESKDWLEKYQEFKEKK